jgi:hypothetical protein
VQAVQTISPSVVVTKPAAQPVQAVVPVEDEYFPAGQLVHVVARPSGGLNLPTTQDTHEVWPAVGWEVPPGQSEHAAVPVPSANWPVGQDVHDAELCKKGNQNAGADFDHENMNSKRETVSETIKANLG